MGHDDRNELHIFLHVVPSDTEISISGQMVKLTEAVTLLVSKFATDEELAKLTDRAKAEAVRISGVAQAANDASTEGPTNV